MTKTFSQQGTRKVVAVLLLASLSAFTLSALARGDHEGHGGKHGTRHGEMHGGMHGGGMGGHGLMMGRGVDRMLDRVNATADQKAQVKKITEAASADLKKHRDAGAALREQGMKLFAAPNVDAAAVEAHRAQMMQHQDQASRRMSQAMVDVSRVLTPDQRKQLAEHRAQRGDMAKRHHQERQQLQDGKRS